MVHIIRYGDKMNTCPDCGTLVMEGDPYCSHCGAHLLWSDDEYESGEEYGFEIDTHNIAHLQSAQICLYWENVTAARENRRKRVKDDEGLIGHYENAVNFHREYWFLVNKFGKKDFDVRVYYFLENLDAMERFRKYEVEFYMPSESEVLLNEDKDILNDLSDIYCFNVFDWKIIRDRLDRLNENVVFLK